LNEQNPDRGIETLAHIREATPDVAA